MPTVRIHDTAGQEFNEPPVVDLGDDSQLGPPTMGDAEDEARREAAYGTPQEEAAPEPEVPASTPEPEFSSESADPLARLQHAGKVRQACVAALEVADRELAVAIVAADEAGVPRRAMSRETGVTRQTVYNILAREAK